MWLRRKQIQPLPAGLGALVHLHGFCVGVFKAAQHDRKLLKRYTRVLATRYVHPEKMQETVIFILCFVDKLSQNTVPSEVIARNAQPRRITAARQARSWLPCH